mmetsp:Transcript_129005/g.413255  ORF Transcript_129005/g.413255 Transcript_129005/m.413255 type:complete len:294 (+) Transcript_129005:175-1056(+)
MLRCFGHGEGQVPVAVIAAEFAQRRPRGFGDDQSEGRATLLRVGSGSIWKLLDAKGVGGVWCRPLRTASDLALEPDPGLGTRCARHSGRSETRGAGRGPRQGRRVVDSVARGARGKTSTEPDGFPRGRQVGGVLADREGRCLDLEALWHPREDLSARQGPMGLLRAQEVHRPIRRRIEGDGREVHREQRAGSRAGPVRKLCRAALYSSRLVPATQYLCHLHHRCLEGEDVRARAAEVQLECVGEVLGKCGGEGPQQDHQRDLEPFLLSAISGSPHAALPPIRELCLPAGIGIC